MKSTKLNENGPGKLRGIIQIIAEEGKIDGVNEMDMMTH